MIKKYRRTKNGLFSNIIGNQRKSSKRRGHHPPKYTLTEFRCEYINNPTFIKLYDNWVESGYDKMMSPSFDRKDDSKGYSFDNIQLMTWRENNEKGHEDKRKGNHNTIIPPRPVTGMHKISGEVVSFISMKEAYRVLKVHFAHISKCCSGQRKSAGGYTWEYRD